MKRTQFGWVFIGVIILIMLIVGSQQNDASTIIPLSIISVLLLLLFYKLTIHVTEKHVKFAIGIGVISGKYDLNDIPNCKSLSYIPFGWGIRFRPGIILFNVSGYKAIELKIKNKNRKVWIGTNCPEEFAGFINSKIHKNKQP